MVHGPEMVFNELSVKETALHVFFVRVDLRYLLAELM